MLDPMHDKVLHRYPGVKPFSTSENFLFFGRQTDIEALNNLIFIKQTVVLYGKSGYGKSSLISAGIIPKLKESNAWTYFPIRFNNFTEKETNQNLSPVQTVKQRLSENIPLSDKNILDKLISNENSFWYFIKKHQSQNSTKNFIFFFDQFEELFTYPKDLVNEFSEQLSELIYNTLPLKFKKKIAEADANQLINDADYEFLYEKPEIKVVFSIRSDRLALLNSLTDKHPNILQHCYELNALNESDAIKAIIEPAKLSIDLGFKTPQFEFNEKAIHTILKSVADPQDGKIEAATLQIVCRYVENVLVEIKKYLLIDENNLGNITDIFQQYYQGILSRLSENERIMAQHLIEDELIDGNRRNPLSVTYIKNKFGLSDNLLLELEQSSLLRKERDASGRILYEVSHDSLLSGINKIGTLRREQEENERSRMLELKIADEILKSEQLSISNLRAESTIKVLTDLRAELISSLKLDNSQNVEEFLNFKKYILNLLYISNINLIESKIDFSQIKFLNDEILTLSLDFEVASNSTRIIRTNSKTIFNCDRYNEAEKILFKYSDNNDFNEFKKNKSIAFKNLINLANGGDNVLQNGLGLAYETGQLFEADYIEAYKWYKKAADQGNSDAQKNMGRIYDLGMGVPQNYSIALMWYQKAEEQGNAFAIANIGNFYADGNYVKKDSAKAVELYRKSADLKCFMGLYNLGYMYEVGDGVDHDYKKAFNLYKEASEYGYSYAFNALGRFYENGYGVTKDYQEALIYYKKGAELGNYNSSKNIANLHFEGLGVEVNFDCAFDWYQKSEKIGDLTDLTDEIVRKFIAYLDNNFSLLENKIHLIKYLDKLEYYMYKSKILDTNGYIELDIYCKIFLYKLKIYISTFDFHMTEKFYLKIWDLFWKMYLKYDFDFYLGSIIWQSASEYGAFLFSIGKVSNAITILEFASKNSVKNSTLLLAEIYDKGLGSIKINKDYANQLSKKAINQGMKKFTIPCDFGNQKHPFAVYVRDTPDDYPYIGIEDQAIWLEKARGGSVPSEVRESFIKLWNIAKENGVSFQELCMYALGKNSEENENSKSEE